jgi:uncharacterized membrane protein YhaH (DUF805 family)
MILLRAVSDAYQRYFQFQGRSSRSEFWFWILFVVVVELALAAGQMLAWPRAKALGDVLTFGFFAFWIASVVPNYAVIFRRLHDLDRSGWWLLVMFVPVVGLLVLIYWLSLRGTDGANRYGTLHRWTSA